MKRTLHGADGYTFVELLVVSTILIILASAMMPLARVTATRQREMELRRVLAAEASARSVKAGALVCIEAQLGLVNRQRISGRVEQIDGETVQVRIVTVEGGVASYRGRAVNVGDVLSDKAASWQLCGQN